MTEIMLRDASIAHVILRYFNVAGADPLERTGQSTKAATHLSRSRQRLPKWTSSEPTIRHRMAPASEITFTFPISSPGYGRGFSVLEAIETVKRVSGVDFKVEFAARRAGDPARLVA